MAAMTVKTANKVTYQEMAMHSYNRKLMISLYVHFQIRKNPYMVEPLFKQKQRDTWWR